MTLVFTFVFNFSIFSDTRCTIITLGKQLKTNPGYNEVRLACSTVDSRDMWVQLLRFNPGSNIWDSQIIAEI